MTVATGYRARPWEQHLRLANALSRAPARVSIEHADDGWVAAHLAVCGRAPVWASQADPRPVERSLVRLGLPPLSEGPADARLTWELRLVGRGRAQRTPTVDRHDVDIITSISGGFAEARDQIRTLQGQGRLIIIDRAGNPQIRAMLRRVPRARVVERPGLGAAEVLAEAAAFIEHDEVLWVPEGHLLLPAALRALLHGLRRRPELGLAMGDVLHLDPRGCSPVGIGFSPRWPGPGGRRPLESCLDRPVLFRARSVEDRAPVPACVLPLWTAGAVGGGLAPGLETPIAPSLALVPADRGLYVIVDDGDEGALAETLARTPPGARTAVLRAVPTAADGSSPHEHLLYGGFGDLERLRDRGPWSLRLSSDPSWAPPPLEDPGALLEVPEDLPSRLVSLAALHGWPLPCRRRAVGRTRLGPVARLARDVREALSRGDRDLARGLAVSLIGAAPSWSRAGLLLDEVEHRLVG